MGVGDKRRKKPRQGCNYGSKFNIQQCVYIGRAHRPIPCFSWIVLQSMVSRQSILLSSSRKLHMQPSWVTPLMLLRSNTAKAQNLFSLIKARKGTVFLFLVFKRWAVPVSVQRHKIYLFSTIPFRVKCGQVTMPVWGVYIVPSYLSWKTNIALMYVSLRLIGAQEHSYLSLTTGLL